MVALALSAWCGAPRAARAASSYTLFESGQVRPLALSPSGKLLFATNTPDNRLEVFRVKPRGLQHLASIPVGLEPVAVAARSETEVWVVNHLSDSVSVVRFNPISGTGLVERTLLVGDEPRDIVFAGPGRRRAFITTAHRGQNSPIDPQLTTPGIGRADVWVFDALALGGGLGGAPLNVITLFSDTPRALAVTPDGDRVYAAAFHSGNRTTVVMDALVPDGGQAAGGSPGPSENWQGIGAPEVGLIVQHDGSHWVDELGRHWDDQVYFSLPDKDVFVIDAMGDPPAQLPGSQGFFQGVGTILYNMAVNPVSGRVYVSNTEAQNQDRFEGPGVFAGTSVRGHLHESRITVLDPATGGVLPRHLNKHIDYNTCCAQAPNGENARSLALPQAMAVTRNGATLYVSALGSDKIGVLDTAALEADTFVPDAASHIAVSGGGPTGILLDEPRRQLYVLTRFDNSISVIDTVARVERAHVAMHSPEPESVVRGRRFLYDASFSSSHGDSSCASCHVFGDFDSLAWDLGDPDGTVKDNPQPIAGVQDPTDPANPPPFLDPTFTIDFHPMKGPMTTQSLRGMANQGAMHWRGDRTGGGDGAPAVQPDGGALDENAAFLEFNVAFPGLLGRDAEIAPEDMQAFADFILQVTYPPNPIRNLDNSLTPDQAAGRDFFFGPPSILFHDLDCESCHRLDPNANPGSSAPGFFGTDGRSSFSFVSQLFKIPHLRNMYQKVGMFGLPPVAFILPGLEGPQGDQVRGFGFTHDGAFDTMFRFFSLAAFTQSDLNPQGFAPGPDGDLLRRQVEEFMFAFDSNLAPIVGQQITLTRDNAALAGPRLDLLRSRADVGECDLVARTALLHHELGFLYVGGGQFMASRQALPPIPEPLLRLLALSPTSPVTFTCAPPGSGERIGLDRDDDGHLDGDERDAGTDPADPASHP
ncbi:YncE family protein [Sorangium cellulosum]|nr:YncE family protein [Sorangium cellulosum]